jgi:serine/threonine protein kinase
MSAINLDNFIKENNTLEMCTPLTLGKEHEWASGTFGTVYVVDTSTCKVAIKHVNQLKGYMNRELKTCKQLAKKNNSNIVKFLGYWIENTNLFLVMEFIPNNLNNILTQLSIENTQMEKDMMFTLMKQLAQALEYLEKIQLMHRDIKPDNILIDICTNRLVLADFGSAKFYKDDETHTTYIGSRFYRAPCLILDRNMYSTKIDIWSFGCVFAEFAYGRPLFTGNTQIAVLSKIIYIIGMPTVDDIVNMPSNCNDDVRLAKNCLNFSKKPWCKIFNKRIDGNLINTSYGEKYEDILDACLQWNSFKRITACDLVQELIL